MLSAFDNLNFYSNDIQWEEMSNAITTSTKSENLSDLAPKEHYEKLIKILTDVAYKYVPAKRAAKKGPQTKIPRERRILMRKRRKLMDQLNHLSTSERKSEKIHNKLIQIEILI